MTIDLTSDTIDILDIIERVEELENEVLSLQSALSNASACLRKAQEK